MERKIGDIKDKKLKVENITLAAIYNILFTNDIVCSLVELTNVWRSVYPLTGITYLRLDAFKVLMNFLIQGGL